MSETVDAAPRHAKTQSLASRKAEGQIRVSRGLRKATGGKPEASAAATSPAHVFEQSLGAPPAGATSSAGRGAGLARRLAPRADAAVTGDTTRSTGVGARGV